MQDFTMDGLSNISGGEFGKLIIDGVGKCSGNIKAETIKIEGTFRCDGAVEADV